VILRIFLFLVILFSAPLGFAAEPPAGLYAYEMADGMRVGAVFGRIPGATEHDELLSVRSAVCDHVEIHTMSDANGIMKMRQIASIPFLKPEDTVLSAQGRHLMLIKMRAPLKAGQVIPMVFVFKQAGEQHIDVPVISRRIE
jgi:copper(I)-binding protein